MQQPTMKVAAGLQVLAPVIRDLINNPKRLELGRCSPREFEQAKAALDWIEMVANLRETRANSY